ncbi:MAG: hypothetical protein Q4G08_06045 [Capnocytophaga sp.]|nr:hypothetical protein [Capnocytophaga sp.]
MNLNACITTLPDVKTLKQILKGRAVLDWIICGHEFETYHTYYKSQQEEYEGNEAQIGLGFEDEDGASLSFYFTEGKCIIIPSADVLAGKDGNNRAFEKKIPKVFQAYYRKHFSDTDTPFALWSIDGTTWEFEENFATSEEITKFDELTTDPKKYKRWALDFFGDETNISETMSEQTITDLYNGKILTEPMVLSIVSEVLDWVDLETELDEMPYRFEF